MKKISIIFIIISTLIVILLTIFFIKKTKSDNKLMKIGNNKDITEIEKNILNINSYKADIQVNIKSNKNENNYVISQLVKENYEYQKVNEPENLNGMELIYENGNLQIKNTNINANKIYENYPYVSNNVLFLTTFIEEYKNAANKQIYEDNNEIFMEVKNDKNNYNAKQILKINKNQLKPSSLEILDMNNKRKIYISYNNIEFNI